MKTIKIGPPKNPDYIKWLAWMDPAIRDRFDSIPRAYEGQTVFVLGGGPSIRTTNLKLIKDRPVLGCNDAWRLGDWVDWMVFADRRWFFWEREGLQTWQELERWQNRENVIGLVPQLLNLTEEEVECGEEYHRYTVMVKRRKTPKWPWLKVVRRDEARFGLSVEQDTVCWNRGCGGAAINVAYLLGAKQVVLLGFDMQMVKGEHNWHNHHQKEERPQIYQNSMRPFMKCFSDALKVTSLQVVNATPGSALDVFPVMPLEEVLEMGW